MRSNNLLNRVVILNMILLAGAVAGFAQSTDQSDPTAIDASGYNGKGPGKETNYFYSFTGGPGEVTVTIGLKAKSYSTFARMEVFDSGMRTVATANMNAATTTGMAGESRTFTLPGAQKVLIKLTLDGNLASYKISLGGAVGTGAGTESGGASGGGGKVKFSKELAKNVDLSKAPKQVSFPQSGTLRVRMKDGTNHEFALEQVQSVTTVAN